MQCPGVALQKRPGLLTHVTALLACPFNTVSLACSHIRVPAPGAAAPPSPSPWVRVGEQLSPHARAGAPEALLLYFALLNSVPHPCAARRYYFRHLLVCALCRAVSLRDTARGGVRDRGFTHTMYSNRRSMFAGPSLSAPRDLVSYQGPAVRHRGALR